MTQHYDNIAVERRASTLWIRIDRPRSRNALSRKTLAELGGAFTHHAADGALKAAVLTGAGEAAFAAGGDLKELVHLRSAEDAGHLFDIADQALGAIRRFPVPVIAALNGVALGGGAELALACDFRIAAPHARVGFIQGQLGLSSGFGGGTDLMRLLGPSRGLAHALNAEILDAHQAHALGLIEEVAQRGETLERCVERFLHPLARLTPQVVRAFKAMALAEREGEPLARRREIEREWFVRTWPSEAHWTAVEARQRKGG